MIADQARLKDRWLQGRTTALMVQGLNQVEALHQAVLDWAEQEILEHGGREYVPDASLTSKEASKRTAVQPHPEERRE